MTNTSKKQNRGSDDIQSYERTIYSAMGDSPTTTTNNIEKPPPMKFRARLFSKIPISTFSRQMKKGKVHRKKMREQPSTTTFSRVLKRLGRKKVSKELEKEFYEWLDNHNMVIQSPLANDTILVKDPNNPNNKIRINKILLQCSVRELHNDLLSDDNLVGLKNARDCNGNPLISDNKLRLLLPPHLRMMSDRYKIMCGCETCTQMYNLHSSYNRYVHRLVKKLENKVSNLPIRSRSRTQAQSNLEAYTDKVMIDGASRFPTAKAALQCMMCAVPDTKFPSLHKIECVLDECNDCKPYDRPQEEELLNDTDDPIYFHLYDTLPSCSLHGMLPKFPPRVPGIRLIRTKTCSECDEKRLEDVTYKAGKFRTKKYLTKQRKTFQDFYKNYYTPMLIKYKYHRFLKIILSKANIEDVRLQRLQPGEVAGSRDYAERLLLKFHLEIQSEHFGQGKNVSIEGNLVHFFQEDCEDKTTNFFSFLSDGAIQNAAKTNLHMDRLIKYLKKKNVLKYRLYETTDGCGKQYRCGTALWFLSSLSHIHGIVIDRSYCAPAHGT